MRLVSKFTGNKRHLDGIIRIWFGDERQKIKDKRLKTRYEGKKGYGSKNRCQSSRLKTKDIRQKINKWLMTIKKRQTKNTIDKGPRKKDKVPKTKNKEQKKMKNND